MRCYFAQCAQPSAQHSSWSGTPALVLSHMIKNYSLKVWLLKGNNHKTFHLCQVPSQPALQANVAPTFHILPMPWNTFISQSCPSFQTEAPSTATFLSMHTPGFGPNKLKEEVAISNESDGRQEEEKERTSPWSHPTCSQWGDSRQHCFLPSLLPLQKTSSSPRSPLLGKKARTSLIFCMVP